MKKLITIIALLIINYNYSQEEWINFKGDSYTIEHPENWEVNTSGDYSTSLLISSELKDDDRFRENINLIIQDLNKLNMTMSMAEFVDVTKNQLSSSLNDAEIISSEGNKERHTMVIKGKMNDTKLKFKQVYILKNNTFYILTFTALEDTYEDFITKGDKIINSFTIK